MSGFTALDFNDYEYIRPLGKGSYSEVTLYRNKKTDELVAIKVFDLGRVDAVYEMDFMKEISILGTLKFPSIIKFFGFCPPGIGKKLSYAFEYMEHGSLDDLLVDIQMGVPHPDFGPTERMMSIYGVAFALQYMHNDAIKDGMVMHRDIKAGNVLLDKDMKPRLADFGFAKVVTEGMPNTPERGSWPWMAPEVMLGKPYSTAADVYSFGMFMYELVTDYTPFIGCLNSKEVIHAVTVKKERPFLPEPEKPIYRVIRMCWDENPKKRPTMIDVCQMIVTETMALPGSDLHRLMEYVGTLSAARPRRRAGAQ